MRTDRVIEDEVRNALLRWGLKQCMLRALPEPANGHPAGTVGVSVAHAA